jgi:hypothetical protein
MEVEDAADSGVPERPQLPAFQRVRAADERDERQLGPLRSDLRAGGESTLVLQRYVDNGHVRSGNRPATALTPGYRGDPCHERVSWKSAEDGVNGFALGDEQNSERTPPSEPVDLHHPQPV